MVDFSKIHLVGIGGTGLSAIARVLVESGYQVTGSDQHMSPLADRLQREGVLVMIGHKAENIGNADLLVISSAIPESNVEIRAARARGIPVMKRSEFLGKLLAQKSVIAVAGTHGKTTTTAMIAWILTQQDQDPSYIIGGVSQDLKTNAHAGSGEFFVIEADEYDRMFLGLQPQIAVITNVEHDHPDYFPYFADFLEAFIEFTEVVRPGGVILVNGEDEGAGLLMREIDATSRKLFTYGKKNPFYDYLAVNLEDNHFGGFSCDVFYPSLETKATNSVRMTLQVPGEHNIANALVALAVTHQAGLSVEKAAASLAKFTGTGRRFEVRGQANGVLVVDDYAHHPTEIRAVLSAASIRYPGRELWTVWQPHTYSRTRALSEEFVRSFEKTDHLIVTDIFPSRESKPEDGYSAMQVVQLMDHPDVHYIPELDQVTRFLLANMNKNDVLLVLSAGDADQISTNVLTALNEREHSHVQ